MATSDSEDFESADEDLDLVRPAQREKPNEPTSDSEEKQVVSEDAAAVTQQTSNNEENIAVDENKRGKHARHERPVRQPREPKPGGIKKLGTRIPTNKTETETKNEVKLEETLKNLSITDQQSQLKEESKQVPVPRTHSDAYEEKGDLQSDIHENKPENNVTEVLDELGDGDKNKNAGNESTPSWGGWGNWGVTSLISTATESVSTLTSHVSQGLTTVLETGIGAPEPETLAKMDKLEEQKRMEENAANEEREEEGSASSEGSGLFGFGNLMSGVSSITRLVETTGSKVLTGGLDTLETIGKKTMEVLQEGDPGLKKKRALFSEKIVLSQILREAKEKAEREDQDVTNMKATKKVHFETLFDDYQGLVHLEALEMLSKQCDLKIQSVLLSATGPTLTQYQESLQELKDACQLPDEEDEVEDDLPDWRDTLLSAGSQLSIPISFEKLTKTWVETEKWLEEQKGEDKALSAQEIHDKGIASLAQLTAEAVEQFHKIAELLLVKEKREPQKESQILYQITTVLSSKLSSMATRFSECLNLMQAQVSDSINELITNVFLEDMFQELLLLSSADTRLYVSVEYQLRIRARALETCPVNKQASNSSSYIQEAFQLLVPVLQVGLLP